MSDLALRAALRLHPAKYRREWGDEIRAVFADTTAGAGRWATARELIDLAGHGMRIRLGLSSSGLLAQLAATVAPFAAAAASGLSLMGLYAFARDWLRHGNAALWVPSALPAHYAYWLDQGSLVLLLGAAVAAVSGRWTVARLAAPLGVAAAPVAWLVQEMPYLLHHHSAWIREGVGLMAMVGPSLLWVLILLAAPPDLLGPPTRKSGLSAFAGVVVGGVVLTAMFNGGPFLTLYYLGAGKVLPPAVCAIELALLVAAVPALRRGRYGPAAAALAGAPIGSVIFLVFVHQLWTASRSTFFVVLGVVAVAVLVVSSWRPTIPERRPPTAG